MSEAQTGLIMATPIIIGFAIALYRMGVLQRSGTALAVCASAIIATILFLAQ